MITSAEIKEAAAILARNPIRCRCGKKFTFYRILANHQSKAVSFIPLNAQIEAFQKCKMDYVCDDHLHSPMIMDS